MRKRNNKCVCRLRWVKVLLILLTTHFSLLTSFAMSVETDRAWYLAGEAMQVSVTADGGRHHGKPKRWKGYGHY